VQYNLSVNSPLDYEQFMNTLSGDNEMAFAAQLGWVPSVDHGMMQYGILHKVCRSLPRVTPTGRPQHRLTRVTSLRSPQVPFFSMLDNKSKIMICAKLLVKNFGPYNPHGTEATREQKGRRITVEGEPGCDMFIVLEGRVRVMQEHREIGMLGVHNFFGEMCILSPPRIDSWGQIHSRTHYAFEDEAVVASLGYDDFMKLRAKRPEINDAVVPYVLECLGHEVNQGQYFFVEVIGAINLMATDAADLAHDASSDPYCIVYLNGHQIGKTPVQFKNLNPTWAYTMPISRHEATYGQSQGAVKLRFELYDYDKMGDNDFLGEVRCTLADLCPPEIRSFAGWPKDAPDNVQKFKLMPQKEEVMTALLFICRWRS